MHEREGEAEAIILVKASPQVTKNHGETVCCAGVTPDGKWMRLYPISFRNLDEARQFGRWDRIKFKWRKPKDDQRPESCRVDAQSIEIVGELPKSERQGLLNRIEVTGVNQEAAAGRSLALLRPKEPRFVIERKTSKEIQDERAEYELILQQVDMFQKAQLPLEPCPYRFKYKYKTDDGEREGTCQDWETDATFFHWRRRYGEEQAVQQMQRVFGEEYPSKGMAFAMGTHSRYPDVWLINGIIRLDEISQLSLL